MQVTAAKQFLPSLYVTGTACFDQCFLFYVRTGRLCFLYINWSLPRGFCNRHDARFFEASVLKGAVFYARYSHKNSTRLLKPKVKTKAGGIFFIKSYNQIFITRYLVNTNCFFIKWEQNHLLPDTYRYNDYRNVMKFTTSKSKHRASRKQRNRRKTGDWICKRIGRKSRLA